MEFLPAFKAWLKALGLFYAGFLVSALAFSLIEVALARLNGGLASPHILNIVVAAAFISLGFFMIHWGWFCFRRKAPFASASPLFSFAAGLLLLPLIAVVGLLFNVTGVFGAAPMLSRIILLAFPVLLLSEIMSAIVKAKEAKAVKALESQAPPPPAASEPQAPQA